MTVTSRAKKNLRKEMKKQEVMAILVLGCSESYNFMQYKKFTSVHKDGAKNSQGKDGTTLNCCEKFSVVLQDSSSFVLLSKLVSAYVQKERRSTEIESSTIFIARTSTNACYFKTTSKITKANELL